MSGTLQSESGSSSVFATAPWRCSAAQNRGAQPSLYLKSATALSGLAAPSLLLHVLALLPKKEASSRCCPWSRRSHYSDSSSTFTTAPWPCAAAQDSGVRPSLSLESASTFPISRSTSITALQPCCAAKDNGVLPSLFLKSASAFPDSSSTFTTASWPFFAAQDSAVQPSLSLGSDSVLPSSDSHRTCWGSE